MKYHLVLILTLIFACSEKKSERLSKLRKEQVFSQKKIRNNSIKSTILESDIKNKEIIFDIMQLKDSTILKNITRDKYGYYTSFTLDIHGKYIFLFDGINLHKIEIETKKVILSKKINITIPVKKLLATTLTAKDGLGVLLFPEPDSKYQKINSVKLLIFDNNLKEKKNISVFYAGVWDRAKALDGILASRTLQVNKSKESILIQKGTHLIDIFEHGKKIIPYKMPKTSNRAYFDLVTEKIYDRNITNKSIDYQGISIYEEKKYHPIDILSALYIFNDKIFFRSKETGNLCVFYIKTHRFVEIIHKKKVNKRFFNGSYHNKTQLVVECIYDLL